MADVNVINVNYTQVSDNSIIAVAQGDVIQIVKNGFVEKELIVPTGKAGTITINIQGKLEIV